MTQDVLVKADENGFYDLRIDNSDFEAVDGFETSIIVSLFSDARADSGSVVEASRRRGWVGDILTADVGRALGSRLWLYEQARLTQTVKNKVAEEAERALEWMVEDGSARSVSASVQDSTTRSVTIRIEIETIVGDVEIYAIIWRRTRGTNISNV